MTDKILKSKITIILLIVLMILSAFLSNENLATENTNLENVTNTVQAAEHDPNHEVNEGRYIPFSDLRDFYDFFCCQHGGIDSHIPSYSNTLLKTEEGEISEGSLTQNDIGKVNFEVTLEGENPSTPFVQNKYTNETYGFYRVKSSEICSPKEAYILAEMLKNIPENEEFLAEEFKDKWYTYVQQAWWTTTAGSTGTAAKEYNDLALEAEAFRDYIVEAAGVSNEDQVTTNTVIEYEYNGQTRTLDCAFDIKYEPRFYNNAEEDVDGSGKVDADDQITVAWDAEKQVYKIGPFKLDYIEAGAKIGERPEIMFAGITNAELYTDNSDEPLEFGKDWKFLWTDIREDSVYPHRDETFYIELNYIDGATKVSNLVFDFKYMNAAGKFEYLEGRYFIANWEAQDKENYCSGGSLCRHGRKYAHTYTAGYDVDGNPIPGNCSGGTPCSHGKFSRHIESKTFWVELKNLEEHNAQLLALGVSAAIVENYTSLPFYIGKDVNGDLKIEKILVDENGNIVESDKEFKFDIYINENYDSTVTVKANSSVIKNYSWSIGEEPPTYKVVEVEEEGTELVEIQNAEGTLIANETVTVIAKNKIEVEKHKGQLQLDKIVIGNVEDRKYEFQVIIGNDLHNVTLSEETGWTWLSPVYEWEEDNAPKYSVKEVNIPDDTNLISLTPSSGVLIDNDGVSKITVTAINEVITEEHEGSLKLDKIAIGNIKDKEYNFEVKIGNDVHNVVISEKEGWTWTSPTYTWEGDNAPRYEVKEINIPEGVELISLSPSSGVLIDTEESSQVTVTAVNNEDGPNYESAKIKVTKRVEGDVNTDYTFKFKLIIEGGVAEYQEVLFELKAGETYISDDFSWEVGTEPCKFKLEEIDIPEGAKLIGIDNESGTLVAGETTEIIVKNYVEEKYESGKIRITKKLDGNAISSDVFKFKITIDGGIAEHQEIYVNLQAGHTYQSEDIVWKAGENAPTYKVEEIDLPEGARLVEIQNAEGTLNSEKPVEVIAINELEEKTGKIKITKQIKTDDKVQNEAVEGTFTISVRITGTFEMNGESIVNGTRTITNQLGAGESFETPEIKWYGNNAPTYTVTETDMPEGWKLESISSQTGSLKENETIEVIVLNNYTTQVVIDLTMELAGDVWEEGVNEEDKNTENSVEDGVYDRTTESPINGVEVVIYLVPYKGNEADMSAKRVASVYTEQGNTKIDLLRNPIITGEGTEEGHWGAARVSVPGLTEEEKAAGYTNAKYFVEFTYDGQTYEPTKFLASGTRDEYYYARQNSSDPFASDDIRSKFFNDSMALDTNREEVNNRIAEVKGDTPIQETTGMTDGKAVGTDGTEYGIKYTSRDNLNTQGKVSEVITTDENGRAIDPFKAKASTAVEQLFYPFDNRVHLENYVKDISELDGGVVHKYYYSATYPYTLHINLGLKRRPSADLSAVKDLTSVKVAVNGKVVEYKYNKLLDKLNTSAQTDSLKDVIATREQLYVHSMEEIEGYNLKIYGTDYYYRTEVYSSNAELYNDLTKFYQELGLEGVQDRELDIYLNYRIHLYNDSLGGYDVEFNEILDYYDESLELVTAEEKKYVQTQTSEGLQDSVVTVAKPSTYNGENSVSWDTTSDSTTYTDVNGEVYKVMSTKSLDNVKVKAGEKAYIDVTFKIKKSAIEGIQDSVRIVGEEDSKKSNIVEIANYSTYDSETGKIAGKIDKDSAPDNVNLGLQKDGEIEGWFEDDTSAAPELNIGFYNETRNINGIAWEDKEEEKVENPVEYNQYVGNGIYDEGEQTLGGLTTELVEKITVKHYSGDTVQKDESGKEIYKEYDFIWPTETSLSKLGGKTINEITGFSSRTTTKESAVETENGTYQFINVPAGNFVVRFTYGDGATNAVPSNEKIKVFNGHDFKTTAYQVGFSTKNEDAILNNEWHDLTNVELSNTRVSDARDSETRRLEVIDKTRVITNSNGEILTTANKAEGEIVNETTGEVVDHTKLFEEFYMYAETAKLNLEIENFSSSDLAEIMQNASDAEKLGGVSISADKVENLTDINYDIVNIDVGLEERSRNEIALDKQISRITLTTTDNTTLLDAQYEITYEPEFDDATKTTKLNAKVTLKDSSIGIDQLQSLDKDEENGLQNFRYINMDERILQGTTIKIEYTLTALNIGEVDLIGEKLENLKSEEVKAATESLIKAVTEYTKVEGTNKFTRNNLVGTYLGSTYYNGTNNEGNKDVVSTSRVRQLVDYVDNDASFAVQNNMTLDHSWRTVKEAELLGQADENGNYTNRIVSQSEGIFSLKDDGTIDASVGSIKDDKGVKYNTENRSNIILSIDSDEDASEMSNKGFMKKLVPAAVNEEDETREYMSQIKLVTTRYLASEADSENMSFDNIAEIVKFESTVGKRDIETTPGNANPTEGEFIVSLEERDTSATELITLTPPTGANLNKVVGIQLILVILAGLLIIAVGIVVIKNKVLSK